MEVYTLSQQHNKRYKQAFHVTTKTTFLSFFQVFHTSDIDITSLKIRSKLIDYCKFFLKFYNIYGHESNWNSLKTNDLIVILHGLQCRGTPCISSETLSNLKSFDNTFMKTVSDGPLEPQVDPYCPNYIIIAPSSIPNAGVGAFARHDIPPEDKMGNYDGTLIGKEKKMKHITLVQDNPYVFSIYRIDTPSGRFVKALDASSLSEKYNSRNYKIQSRGSWHRYVNESRSGEPNTEYRVETPAVKGNKNKYFVHLYSLKTIKQGEELTAVYFSEDGVSKAEQSSKSIKKRSTVSELTVLPANSNLKHKKSLNVLG